MVLNSRPDLPFYKWSKLRSNGEKIQKGNMKSIQNPIVATLPGFTIPLTFMDVV